MTQVTGMDLAIGLGIGAAALAQPPTLSLVPHEYHWSQIFHFLAMLGDATAPLFAIILIVLSIMRLRIARRTM